MVLAEKEEGAGPEIGTPFNVTHNVHVDFVQNRGFQGLPVEWQAMLRSSGIPEEEIMKYPQMALQVIKFHTGASPTSSIAVSMTRGRSKTEPDLPDVVIAATGGSSSSRGDSATLREVVDRTSNETYGSNRSPYSSTPTDFLDLATSPTAAVPASSEPALDVNITILGMLYK